MSNNKISGYKRRSLCGGYHNSKLPRGNWTSSTIQIISASGIPMHWCSGVGPSGYLDDKAYSKVNGR